ncbi:MAG: putative metal-binding integral rane protein [Phycisphaerales bacterium]|nr:putative metal-binding integral rane protein [Phycisphaerales bacterium]
MEQRFENPTVARSGLSPATGERVLYATAIAVFVFCAWLTWHFCTSMGGDMDMLMPGGWTMSGMWMWMPGQTWAGSTVMFLAMWVAMMVAMMLPSVLPMVVIYRRAAAFRQDRRPDLSAALLILGYFGVWSALGLLAYAAGMLAADAAMRWTPVSRAVPPACGAALVACGIFQLTPMKSACLRHCRDPLGLVACHVGGGPLAALRLGIHHGLFCAACCWALMVIQLVLGIMGIPVMVAVAAVIALEKLIPCGQWVARLTGVAAIAGGAFWMIRSLIAMRVA